MNRKTQLEFCSVSALTFENTLLARTQCRIFVIAAGQNRSAPACLACCLSWCWHPPFLYNSSKLLTKKGDQNKQYFRQTPLPALVSQVNFLLPAKNGAQGNILPLSQREGCIKLLAMPSGMEKGNNPTSLLCYRQIPNESTRFLKNCGRTQCPARS